mgnify:CR=1 FL=1
MSEFDNLIKKRAVALKYDSKNNRAPIIVASGMGYLAERITEAAAEAVSYTHLTLPTIYSV